eukprot:COSAG06_NODE_8903_length_2036_cov_5.176562_3_plen_224_part_00
MFGRDEGGSEFTFTQQHVDLLLDNWSQTVRAVGYNATAKPTADRVMVVELCISDRTKPLLLANPAFIPYLVDALLLDPAHPRAGMEPELKAWCQTTHAECLAQVAVFRPDGREALRQDPSVRDALRCVAESGLTDEARRHAESALLALSDTELVKIEEGQKHVMLSCACVVHCHTYFGAPVVPCFGLTDSACCSTVGVRPMGCTGHDQESERVFDRSWVRDVV